MFSENCGPMSCSPTGSPSGVKPHGTLIPGSPASGAPRVKTSARYMDIGSCTFSPSRNAGVGEVGVAMRSTSANARS